MDNRSRLGRDGLTIQEDGRLLSALWHVQPIPEENQEFRNDLNCLLKAGGQMRKVVDGLIHRNFAGIIHFSRYHER